MGAIVLFKDILWLFDHVTKAMLNNPFFAGLFGILLLGLGGALFILVKATVKR